MLDILFTHLYSTHSVVYKEHLPQKQIIIFAKCTHTLMGLSLNFMVFLPRDGLALAVYRSVFHR